MNWIWGRLFLLPTVRAPAASVRFKIMTLVKIGMIFKGKTKNYTKTTNLFYFIRTILFFLFFYLYLFVTPNRCTEPYVMCLVFLCLKVISKGRETVIKIDTDFVKVNLFSIPIYSKLQKSVELQESLRFYCSKALRKIMSLRFHPIVFVKLLNCCVSKFV